MEINQRFFKAFDALMAAGKIVSLTNFCETYGLYRVRYQRMRTNKNNESRYKNVENIAIGYLVKDFDISADWILTGRGKMFN